jgi:hypothetical protein
MKLISHLCVRKRRYEHEYAAWQSREAFRESGNPDGFRVQIYHCLDCDGWHLGKRDLRTQAERHEFLRGIGRVKRLVR